MLVHGTCVALKAGRRWHGVLLRGPSGSGKSDLALRLIEGGARLVADDQTRLVAKGRTLEATGPEALKAMIEVRGVGIVTLRRAQTLAAVPLRLLVDLVAPSRVDRMPDPAQETLEGIALPLLAMAPFEASAPAKLRLALARITAA